MQTSKKVQPESIERFEHLLSGADRLDYSLLEDADTDLLIEKLIDSMQCSPLGRLLNVISSLPEVRTEKVEQARRQIHQPDACWDTRMSLALDRVLEEMVFEE